MESNIFQNSFVSFLPVFAAIIGLLAAIIAGYLAHLFSARRDRENKRREQITHYLLEAFLLISRSINGRVSEDSDTEIQKAIDLIQIFGNNSQIKLAKEFSEELASAGDADVYPLLHEIRNDLRKQLEMPIVTDKMTWITLGLKERELLEPRKGKR
jgi:hypothetical protein